MSLILRRIDAEHPFIAPGPNDKRGPCPMLNTLANHGYFDRRCVRVYPFTRIFFLITTERSGVDTGENIIKGAMEAVNLERNIVAAFVGIGIVSITFND